MKLWICLSHHRPRLALSEPETMKEPLTLTDTEHHAVAVSDEGPEALAVPQGAGQAERPWGVAEDGVDVRELFVGQASRSPRPIALGQTREAVLFETTDPVLHRARGISEHFGDGRASQALGDQQDTMKPMVIPGVGGTTNLILKTQNDFLRILDRESSHIHIESENANIRNYLCRRV